MGTSLVQHERMTALVLWSTRKHVIIQFREEELRLPIPGKWHLDAQGIRPFVPGDRIELALENDVLKISDRLERRNDFTRKLPGKKPIPQTLAVNLDRVCIIASIEEPRTPFGFIDRMLVCAELGQVPAVIIINKIDLDNQQRRDELTSNYINAVDSILTTSAVTEEGTAELIEMLPGKITLIAGSSGVGKSSLINLIEPGLDLKTGSVSDVTGKGKHITSSAKLHRLSNGGWIIDTPGLRECAPWGMMEVSLGESFPEIRRLSDYCHFRNCLHRGESGCAIEAAIGTNDLPAARYQSYLKLLNEAKPSGYSAAIY